MKKKIVEISNVNKFTDEVKLNEVKGIQLRRDILRAKVILSEYIEKFTFYKVNEDNLRNANSIFKGLDAVAMYLALKDNPTSEDIKYAFEMILKNLITFHPYTKANFWNCFKEILNLPSFSENIHKTFKDYISCKIDSVLCLEKATKLVEGFQEIEKNSTATFFEYKHNPDDQKNIELLSKEIKNLVTSFEKNGVINSDEIVESLKKVCPSSLTNTPYFRFFKEIIKSFEVFLSNDDLQKIYSKVTGKEVPLATFG